MKRLYLIRHGKSAWDSEGTQDIDRPLKEKGINDAYEMAGRLVRTGSLPELLLTSPAARASHTALIFARIMNVKDEAIEIRENLYLAGPSEILGVIGTIPDNINSAALFGHNPGFTDLANKLSNLRIDNVPTSGMVVMDFQTSLWKDISNKTLLSASFDYPSKPAAQ